MAEGKITSFQEILGNEMIKEHFLKAIESHRISHAYILTGEEGTGRKSIANAFAMTLLCEKGGTEPCMVCHSCKQALSGNHPDLIYVTHEKPASIGVDDIREQINDTIQIRPYSSYYKIYIVDEAEKMTVQAQNALLKTLEEPPAYAVIILLTNNKDRLLDTILSRCVTMTLGSVREEKIVQFLKDHTEAKDEDIKFAASFSLGNIGKAMHVVNTPEFKEMFQEAMNILIHIKTIEVYEIIAYLKDLKAYKDEIYDFLDVLTVWYRDMLMLKTTGSLNHLIYKDKYRQLKEQEIYISFEGISHILDEIKKARRRLAANVNFEVALEMLLLTMKENGKVW